MITEEQLKFQLKNWFGFDHFRHGQLEPIQSILKGEDTIAVIPTGAGKSLIYQYCGYALDGLVVIVSPLLSLMDNQVTLLKVRGEKRAAALNSMLSLNERILVEKNLASYKFLFVSPEMLQSKRLQERLMHLKVSLLVIDEAHCISQWGQDFRPDYLFLGQTRERLGNPLTLALTATAPLQVIDDIIRFLHLPKNTTKVYRNDPNRNNIFYHVEEVKPVDKDETLLNFLQTYPSPGIIYFSSKSQAEKTAAFLKQRTNLRVDTYHADRSGEDRTTIQRQFINDHLDLICATTAFGMGINKPNIRYVIHYHIPNSLEEYVQETGRAGRDGHPAISTLLYSREDFAFKYRKSQETSLTEHFLQFLQKQQYDSLGELDDSDTAMLQIIQHKKMNASMAASFVQQRLHERKQKLNDLSHIIESESCKRALISTYFDHQLENRPDWCCSYCQKEWSSYIEKLPHKQEQTSDVNELQQPWQEKIKVLFRI